MIDKLLILCNTEMVNIKRLAISLGVVFLVALAGSIVTSSEISTWYAGLQKPSFNPPNWVFGPVWTVLYFLMGISLYLVWNTSGKKSKHTKAIQIFLLQLGLNLLWSVVFFGFHMPIGAFVVILLLGASIVYTILLFFKISKPAAYLLTPYLLWVSFASVLNLAIAALN